MKVEASKDWGVLTFTMEIWTPEVMEIIKQQNKTRAHYGHPLISEDPEELSVTASVALGDSIYAIQDAIKRAATDELHTKIWELTSPERQKPSEKPSWPGCEDYTAQGVECPCSVHGDGS